MAIKPVSGEIKSQDINDNLSYLDGKKTGMNDLTEDVKQSMTGGSVPIVGDNSVYTGALNDKVVTYDKVAFMNASANLFNKKKSRQGYTVNDSDGNIIKESSLTVSDYIRVDKNADYFAENIYKASRFDINKKIINSYYGSGLFNVYESEYIVLVFKNKDVGKVTFGKGNKAVSPEFFVKFDDEVSFDEESINEISSSKITGEINELQTGFITNKNNLISVDELLKYTTINDATGLDSYEKTTDSTPKVAVTKNKDIICKDVYKILRYDEKNKIISNVYLGKGIFKTNTLEAASIRAVVFNSSDTRPQINYGTELLEYDEGQPTIKENVKITSDNLKEPLDKEKLSIVKRSENLITKDNTIEYFNIKDNTGEIENVFNSVMTDFIEVEQETRIYIRSVAKILRYDENNEVINQVHFSNENDYFGTYQAKKIRAVFNIQNIDKAMMSYSEIKNVERVATTNTFENGIGVLSSDVLRGKKHINAWRDDIYTIDNICNDYYHQEKQLEADLTLQTSTFDYIYKKYDNLMAKYPNLITRKLEQTTSSGLPVYSYTFKTTEVSLLNNNNDMVNVKYPKMLLHSCIHGEEKLAALNLFNAMSEIVENWESNKVLEMLHWNCEFIVVPVVNPWGYNNNSRLTENGVDMGRNWSYGHGLNGYAEGSNQWGGKEPFSEAGTKTIKQIVDREPNIIFMLSHHTFIDTKDTDIYMWYSAGSKYQVNVGKRLVSAVSRNMSKRFNTLPKNRYFGYVDGGKGAGGETTWAISQNIQAIVFEVCPKIVWLDNAQRFDSNAVTMSCEGLVNALATNLIKNVEYYNRY